MRKLNHRSSHSHRPLLGSSLPHPQDRRFPRRRVSPRIWNRPDTNIAADTEVSRGSTSSFAASFGAITVVFRRWLATSMNSGSGSRNRAIPAGTPSTLTAGQNAPRCFRSHSRQRVRPAECDGTGQEQHPVGRTVALLSARTVAVIGEKLTGVVAGFLHRARPWPAILEQDSMLGFGGSSLTNTASHPKNGVDSTPRFERHHPLADLKSAVIGAPAR